MRYIRLHISEIIAAYDGKLPLTHFLKQHFKKHPKLGSRDRKLISEMVYSWYRSAKALDPALSLEERTDIAVLLQGSENKHVQSMTAAAWHPLFIKNESERLEGITAAGISYKPELLLDAGINFSRGITREAYLASMIRRPDLFLRLQPQYVPRVYKLLTAAGIHYQVINDRCIALANGAPIDQVLEPQMYRVQDLSSQQTGTYFDLSDKFRCWDCCCGAGGKSLLLLEQQARVALTVSDIRATILDNLSSRFRVYEYPQPERLRLSAADQEQTQEVLGPRRFDRIVADVPCSGSGTWARTPEQLYFFDPATIPAFSERQKAITNNVVRYLKPGAQLIYITCSVFAAENEEVVQHLLQQHSDLRVLKMDLINGTDKAADSMFVAVIKKAGKA